MGMKMRNIKIWALLVVLLMAGCTTINRTKPLRLPRARTVAILPFINNTETMQADQRARSMVSHLLQTKGARVAVYPERASCNKLMSCKNPNLVERQAISWAKRKQLRYVLTGSVNEWRYKVGLDGEPSVSLSLRIIDIRTKNIVWSSVGSKIGGSRSSLGNIAQKLLVEMLDNVNWG